MRGEQYLFKDVCELHSHKLKPFLISTILLRDVIHKTAALPARYVDWYMFNVMLKRDEPQLLSYLASFRPPNLHFQLRPQ
jgi:hypothetical protein